MNPYATHTAIALFTLGASSVHAVELIVNGGFEAAPPAPGGTIIYAGASDPPGWTHVGGTVWTLYTGYAEGSTVVQAHGGSVSAAELTFESERALEVALHLYRQGSADFADCLHVALATQAAEQPLWTFDKGAARISGAQLLVKS